VFCSSLQFGGLDPIRNRATRCNARCSVFENPHNAVMFKRALAPQKYRAEHGVGAWCSRRSKEAVLRRSNRWKYSVFACQINVTAICRVRVGWQAAAVRFANYHRILVRQQTYWMSLKSLVWRQSQGVFVWSNWMGQDIKMHICQAMGRAILHV